MGYALGFPENCNKSTRPRPRSRRGSPNRLVAFSSRVSGTGTYCATLSGGVRQPVGWSWMPCLPPLRSSMGPRFARQIVISPAFRRQMDEPDSSERLTQLATNLGWPSRDCAGDERERAGAARRARLAQGNFHFPFPDFPTAISHMQTKRREELVLGPKRTTCSARLSRRKGSNCATCCRRSYWV